MPSETKPDTKNPADRHYELLMALVVAAVALRKISKPGPEPGEGSVGHDVEHAKRKFTAAGVELIAFTLVHPAYYERTHDALLKMGKEDAVFTAFAKELKRTHDSQLN